MSIDTNIKELTIETVNGALGIDSKESFNMNINSINGAANIKMENFDANIKINSINGGVSTFLNMKKVIYFQGESIKKSRMEEML